MKLNLQHIILSAAVSAILVVINPLRSFAQESDLVPRQYTEKPSTQESNDFEAESLSEEENVATKNEAGSYTATKDSIISSTAKSNQLTSHRHPRARANNDAVKQPESQKQAEKAKEEKDSILSFNFIYYIFKKFKWSDIVD